MVPVAMMSPGLRVIVRGLSWSPRATVPEREHMFKSGQLFSICRA
jgi:hypothetical protein